MGSCPADQDYLRLEAAGAAPEGHALRAAVVVPRRACARRRSGRACPLRLAAGSGAGSRLGAPDHGTGTWPWGDRRQSLRRTLRGQRARGCRQSSRQPAPGGAIDRRGAARVAQRGAAGRPCRPEWHRRSRLGHVGGRGATTPDDGDQRLRYASRHDARAAGRGRRIPCLAAHVAVGPPSVSAGCDQPLRHARGKPRRAARGRPARTHASGASERLDVEVPAHEGADGAGEHHVVRAVLSIRHALRYRSPSVRAARSATLPSRTDRRLQNRSAVFARARRRGDQSAGPEPVSEGPRWRLRRDGVLRQRFRGAPGQHLLGRRH